jgi:GT2 family glycosyltransferase
MCACSCEFALFLDDDSWPEARESVLAALKTMIDDHLGIVTFTYKALADGTLSVPLGRQRGRVTGFLGGASLFHVPSVLKVGGYRGFWVYGGEEPELTMRLWLAGVSVEYLPGVIILHNQYYTPEEGRDYWEYDYLYARNTILMSSLNMPLLLGLPYGFFRAVRWSVYRNRNYTAKSRGLAVGVFQSFSRLRERQPCSWRQAAHWILFLSQVPK